MPYDKNVMASNLKRLRREKSARENRDFRQCDVADAIGVSTATVVNYENGDGSVSYEVAWALADLYGVQMCDLGGRDERKAS